MKRSIACLIFCVLLPAGNASTAELPATDVGASAASDGCSIVVRGFTRPPQWEESAAVAYCTGVSTTFLHLSINAQQSPTGTGSWGPFHGGSGAYCDFPSIGVQSCTHNFPTCMIAGESVEQMVEDNPYHRIHAELRLGGGTLVATANSPVYTVAC